MDSVHQWMGNVFYRGVNPSSMGYTELRYYSRWSEVIAETELSESLKLQGG